MKRAIVYGSCTASFAVEKFGTERIKHVTKHEIDNRMFEFFQLIHFDAKHHLV